MGNIPDIQSMLDHKVSIVICLKCFYRWTCVRPVSTPLKTLECENCGPGYAIETGEDTSQIIWRGNNLEEDKPAPLEIVTALEEDNTLLKAKIEKLVNSVVEIDMGVRNILSPLKEHVIGLYGFGEPDTNKRLAGIHSAISNAHDIVKGLAELALKSEE